ncbi:GDSL esterase/lipase 1-like isoform X2 [Juglans microcarpa x Juglans regia]|uniref:GDSL esterase/lipase 1-like isoform X2 n=1 Tax=Juglans microcarpa x Juglans regia TaxID=2249226 RepID=UPI001B7E5D99|nr:GDSL esterase/lipase 1-like isoform X2 [Juglans microcarpa x Juglans regia]
MADLGHLFCVLVSLLHSVSCNGQPKAQGEHKTLFVFGDSLFDPGNNQYLNDSVEGGALPWPYGETYFGHSTGRLSDGRLVPDFVAQFAKLPILPPYLQPITRRFTDGANFASAGGGVLVQTHPGTLSYFKSVVKSLRQKLGDVEAKKLLMKAVYLFSIGGNDYFSFYTQYPNATQPYRRQYVGMVIGNLTSVLEEIHGLGGRKIAFQNAGPLGCLPAMKARDPQLGSECAEEPSALARLHNRALANVLKKLENKLPGFKYSIFDYYSALGDRVQNPSKYGFKNGKAACCGSGAYKGQNCGGGRNGTEPFESCSNPNEYVWFDGGHTTERANRQLAELIWSGGPRFTGPYNVKQLFEHP